MAQENTSIPNIVASAARTTDHVSRWIKNDDYLRAHVVVDVSAAAGSTASFTVTVEGRVPGSTRSYDLLVGSAITATGRTVLKVGPGIAAAANAAAQDMLPSEFRITSTHAGAQSLTWSCGAHLGL